MLRPKSKFKIVGVRPGEKIFEELISKFDSFNTFNLKNCYSIIDPNNEILLKKYNKSKYKRVKRVCFNYFKVKVFFEFLNHQLHQ